MHVNAAPRGQADQNHHDKRGPLPRVGRAASPPTRSRSVPFRARAALRDQLIRRPWVTLGVATAAGFLVAGGMTSPAMWGLARLGARLALVVGARELDAIMLAPEPAPDPTWPA